ncbi:DNA-binding protein [Streptomyces kurssanovii]|nr:DNA-binding protein [Streptomyces kurssanovii]
MEGDMLNLAYLVQHHRELELEVFAGCTVSALANVSTLAFLEHDQLERMGHAADDHHPPATLFLLQSTPQAQANDAVARLLPYLARHRAAGLAIAGGAGFGSQTPEVFMPSTLSTADRLAMPLMTTTAPLEVWQRLATDLDRYRIRYAERQANRHHELLQRLPSQLADERTTQRVVDWLATVLDARVVVRDTCRGVLAAAHSPTWTHRPAAPIHSRRVSLTPTGRGDAVLDVEAKAPLDHSDAMLIQHAAKLCGLVDQARTFEAVAQSAREARTAAHLLFLNGEPDKALKVLDALIPGFRATKSLRVYIVECGSAHQREAMLRRYEAVVADRALVVRCPHRDRQIVVVEPATADADATTGLARDLHGLVLTMPNSPRLGGSNPRPFTQALSAYHEAQGAVRLSRYTQQPVLQAGSSNPVDLLDPSTASAWARAFLAPLDRLPAAQAADLRHTLPVALSNPHTEAARILNVHRNTVAYRLARVGELLDLDLSRTNSKVLVGLALDMGARPVTRVSAVHAAPDLRNLLSNPRLEAWARALVEQLESGTGDLARTVQTWLDSDTHVETTAKTLGMSEATVRSRLRSSGRLLDRDLTSLPGLRDVALAFDITARHSAPGPALAAA